MLLKIKGEPSKARQFSELPSLLQTSAAPVGAQTDCGKLTQADPRKSLRTKHAGELSQLSMEISRALQDLTCQLPGWRPIYKALQAV